MSTFIEIMNNYLEHSFVRYAIIVGLLIAICSSLIGVTLVLKRFSFIGDGLSHVAFGAMAMGTVLNLADNMLLTLPITIISAVVLLKSGQNAKIKGDAAIAMLSVSALAFGYLLLNIFSASSNVSGDVCTTLFGSTSILTLTERDVIICIILSVLIISSFIFLYHSIFDVTFDEDFATVNPYLGSDGVKPFIEVCKEENKVAPGIQWNQIHRAENLQDRIINYFRVSCQHCDNPACLPVCPAKAIYKGPHGEVLVDQSKCIGCGACAMACPYGAPKFNRSGKTSYWDVPALASVPLRPHQQRTPGKAERCTLCVQRTSNGQVPKCVEACAVKALTFVDYDNLTPEQKALVDKSVALNEAAGTKPKVRYIASYMDIAGRQEKMF